MSDGETVVRVTGDEEMKCPMCLWRVGTLYRTTDEDDEDAVCGDCFAGWLADTNAEVSVDE